MDRRTFVAAAGASMSAAALGGLSLALQACAPKRFPWPGETQAWTAKQIDVLSSQCIQPQASLTPMLEAILDTGQKMDEGELPDEGRVLILPQRSIGVVNSEFGHPVLKVDAEPGECVGWIDRFKVFRCEDQFSPYAWQHQPGADEWTRGYDVMKEKLTDET